MNKKQWTGLLMVYVSYLLLGATIFLAIESPIEEKERSEKLMEYLDIIEDINKSFDGRKAEEFAEKLSDYCGKNFDLRESQTLDEVVPEVWNFYSSFFFVVTVVSTIGYGNLHPTTGGGRVLMIVYAIIGIPLNGILLSSLGQFFGAVFHRAHRKYKTHGLYGARCGLVINVLSYLTPGLIIFIFLPAGLFCIFEDWDYIESVYFAFVTLTTIGFGDLVAGGPDSTGGWVYKVGLVCWVIFGLGYLIMLLGFVAQAMQAKKIVQLEEKLLTTLTHSRIWHGFSKDIGYLRRLMNELYLDKLKPVFRDEKEAPPHPSMMPRCKSLPDINFDDDEDNIKQAQRRRRAMSEFVPLHRVFSESDLQRIDRNATFAATAAPMTYEFMKRVIDVYTGCQIRQWPSAEEEEESRTRGVEGFSDEDVLSSETWTNAPSSRHPSSLFNVNSYEDTVSRQPHRGRAMSECPPPELKDMTTSQSNPVDWTWSGPNANKLQDFIKQRQKNKIMMELNKVPKSCLSSSVIAGTKRLTSNRRRSRCVTENNSQEDNINFTSRDVSKNILATSVPNNIGGKRRSLQDNSYLSDLKRDLHYMTTTAAVGRPTDFTNDLHKLYKRGDHVFSNEANRKEMLDETSLADFIRVLTNLHSRVGERLVATEQNQPKPRRKMGTASLTPPRIRSLLELFPDPLGQNSSRGPKKQRKPSRITNLFRTDSKRDCSSNMPTTEDSSEKPQEQSNLKRLGRFLLRSYSIAPKDTEDLVKSQSKRKRFSLWPTDSECRNDPPFQLQVDSPSEVSNASVETAITIEPDDSSHTGLTESATRSHLFPPPNYPSPQNPTPTRKNSNPYWLMNLNTSKSEPKDKLG